jgi:hypothetical protein
MRLVPLALLALLLPLAHGPRDAAHADDAAKDIELANLRVQLERLREENARLAQQVLTLEAALAKANRDLEAARKLLPTVGPLDKGPHSVHATQGQETSREQLRYLVSLYRSFKPAAGQPQHPALDGKRFVLWLVAVNQLEKANEGALKMLFSPADNENTFPGVTAYAAVTAEALTRQAFPGLTSYAGRRNADPALAITATSAPAATALFADLSYADGALVAFLDGKVRYLNRRDLGLGPTDPIVAGPASKSPLLQTLSSE